MGKWVIHQFGLPMLADGKSSVIPYIITVSARALFDLEEENQVFKTQGIDAFQRYQAERANEVLKPGPLFSLVRKLLAFNDIKPDNVPPFEVVLLSRNSTDTSVRVLNSIEHYGLPMIRAVFTGGRPSTNYLPAIGANLFLSSNAEEVARAIKEYGIAAATIPTARKVDPSVINDKSTEIHIAFDGDSVLFSDEAERVYGERGLEGFQRHEHEKAHIPLEPGPFRGVLEAIHRIQQAYPKNQCPIRTALVTARSFPAHLRANNTLTDWGVNLDEGMYLGGRNKAPFLKAFQADLFFDDSQANIDQAMDVTVSAHVPWGIRNELSAAPKRFSGDDVVAVGEPSPVETPAAPAPRRRRAGPR